MAVLAGDAQQHVQVLGFGLFRRQITAERFVRLENSRSEPGSGLGLSLVAAVAEAHGGRLELSEGPGKVGEMGPGLRVAPILPRAA